MSDDPIAAINSFLAEARNAIVIGLRRDGRPHATPNWFLWEDGTFFVSTTKGRVKYRMFAHNPTVQLVVDDSVGFRYLVIDGTVAIVEDVEAGVERFARLRAKHGRGGQSRDELLEELRRDERVLLAITPAKAPADWLRIGL